MNIVTILFVAYGLFALVHILAQVILGHLEYRRQRKSCTSMVGPKPPVGVVVPVYNETPARLEQCLGSLREQIYEGELTVFVVDDGSTAHRQQNAAIFQRYAAEGFQIIRLDRNVGKRQAQVVGFDRAQGEFVVTVDSDTLLPDRRAISTIVSRFSDPAVGAVTGHVLVENTHRNLLTRLIRCRYWMAFNQERAAQSLFKVVMCCSGPFSAYRKGIINQVRHKYITQSFLGKPCTFGDDRHLTNLVLDEGFNTVYDMRALASTYVPERLGEYLRQQLRWNKSFYREMLWTLKAVRKHNVYLFYDLLMQFILPLMLAVAVVFTLVEGVTGHLEFVLMYLVVMAVVALLRTIYGFFRTWDPWFLVFVVYGLIHVLFLLPVRLFALVTLRSTGWGTRQAVLVPSRRAIPQGVRQHGYSPTDQRESVVQRSR